MGINNKEQNNQKQVLPNQAMLFLRGFIGFYLIYLAYGLIRDESKVAPRMVVIIFSIIFVIAGIFMLVWIIRSWIRGEYVGGKADTTVDEEYTEYEEDFEDETAESIGIEKTSDNEMGTGTVE